MTAEIVNLRQARKRKARSEREKTADANRVAFGRSKAERQLSGKTKALETARIEAHRVDQSTPDTGTEKPD
ncbi:DUF4169 family protein [Roseibium litorale]|uniref:DUF4169 family protein n=1 Tax=Roseibium litorale TaxID=2803841 RepID=A0ABR9CI97_9HYPH|nr:DUF4169 family protein [Roseibium litorale]MBD8890543.1 DUF4169 family protein [Roseibium litorale]